MSRRPTKLALKWKARPWVFALAFAAVGFSGRSEGSGQASVSAPSEGEEGQLALQDNLSLEHRRYLLYLYARLGKPKIAEQLSERILNEAPGDKQTYLVMASMYLELRQTEKALLTGKRLAKLYPDDNQAIYFLGAAHYQAGQFQEANEIFSDLKKSDFEGKLYPYQTDLASSALGAGDWYRAMLAYQELLRKHQLGNELRLKAREVLEGIYYEHLPQAGFREEITWLDAGRSYRSLLDYRQHFKDSQRVFAHYGRVDLRLEEVGGLRANSTANQEGWIGLESVFSPKYSTEIYGGVWEEGALGGAAVTRAIAPERHIRLRLDGNEASRDSLLMESLNGRQHEASLSMNWAFNHKWVAYGQLSGREAVLAGESLGLGAGASFNLEHILLHKSPHLRVGYRGVLNTFERNDTDPTLVDSAVVPSATLDQRRAIARNLILSRFHRHGAYATWRDNWSGVFYYEATAGVDYDVESDSWVRSAMGRLRFYPRKSVELSVEGGYSSSAATADQNSAQWLLGCGLKLWF